MATATVNTQAPWEERTAQEQFYSKLNQCTYILNNVGDLYEQVTNKDGEPVFKKDGTPVTYRDKILWTLNELKIATGVGPSRAISIKSLS
jgi:hypothetical protein